VLPPLVFVDSLADLLPKGGSLSHTLSNDLPMTLYGRDCECRSCFTSYDRSKKEFAKIQVCPKCNKKVSFRRQPDTDWKVYDAFRRQQERRVQPKRKRFGERPEEAWDVITHPHLGLLLFSTQYLYATPRQASLFCSFVFLSVL